jgi:hypothetical protein
VYKRQVLSLAFLLAAFPVMAKGSNETQGQQGQGETTNTQMTSENGLTVENKEIVVSKSPTEKAVVSPSGKQVKNENQVQTQNMGEEKELSVKTKENEMLNDDVDQSMTKVSDQVHQLIETVGAKGGIGPQVKEIAQNQVKVQDEIKADFEGLNSRGTLAKLLVGSDKKMIQSLEQKMEQNRLMIQQLEELKLKTKNTGDLQQLQETIDLMTYQNTSLQNKIDKESKVNGLFGWLVKLFN